MEVIIMIVLTRRGNEVFFGNQKLTINPQQTKGPNKEVVKIEGLPGTNGQKWVSLTRLVEGDNELECQGREVTITKKYVLTKEEQEEVNRLQARIDEIVEGAKKRYIPKPNLNVDPAKLTKEQKASLIEQIKQYYGM